jgi:hypothetical protein
MKKKVSLVLFLLLCMGQIASAESADVAFEKRSQGSPCFDLSALSKICCKRGKQGPRGRRGPRGRDGVCAGLGELFINAQMMSWTPGEITRIFPPNNFYPLFPPLGTFIYTWTLFNSTISSGLPPVGAVFKIPVDLDRTQPVTVVVHCLVNSLEQATGDQAKIQVNMDYQPDNGVLGSTPPATGFADTQVSPDFTVTQPVPIGSDNRSQISTSIVLDQTQIDGEWAFIGIKRIAPVVDEFSGTLFLSTVSVQYSRICS